MKSRFSFLFESTSLHGFKLLSNESSVTWKKGFTRIFWTAAFGLSFYFMTGMLKNMIKKASESTTIIPDTSYLQWENTFPAVSFCLAKGRSTEPMKMFIKENVPVEIFGKLNIDASSSFFESSQSPRWLKFESLSGNERNLWHES
jgi:hypothetical protein